MVFAPLVFGSSPSCLLAMPDLDISSFYGAGFTDKTVTGLRPSVFWANMTVTGLRPSVFWANMTEQTYLLTVL